MIEPDRPWKRLLRQDIFLAAVAVIAGTAGIVLASRYLQARADARDRQMQERYASVQVAVAATDLAQGELIEVRHLAARSMPRDFLPMDAVGADGAAALLGQRARIDIRRGTPIVPSAVQRDEPHARLSAILAEDERALTIPVDEISSHAGQLRVGDRVDLYLAMRQGTEAMLVPLLQSIEVLGLGSDLRNDPASDDAGGQRLRYATVTLRVLSSDAPRVALAQQDGELTVLLRPEGDVRPVQARIVREAELMRPTPAVPRPLRPGMELLVGGSGTLAPERSWLAVGKTAAGDAS